MERIMDNRDWKIHRNSRGAPYWWQKYYEAWLVITGHNSLHKAWQRGIEQGTQNEYRRLIVNKAAYAELTAKALKEKVKTDATTSL